MLLEEGGHAIKTIPVVGIKQANVKATVEDFYNKVLKPLGVSSNEFKVIGSAGKKHPDTTSGDIDTAVLFQPIIQSSSTPDSMTLNDVFDIIKKQVLKTVSEVADMRHLGLLSIPWPIVGKDQEGKYVQIDIMPTDDLKWTTWSYFSPAYTESKYKGVYRNVLLSDIARFANLKILLKSTNASGEEAPAVWRRLFFDVSRGLLQGTQSALSKKTKKLLKTHKTISKKFISKDPDKVVKILLGPDFSASDIMTFESLWRAIHSNKFLYKSQLNNIVKSFRQGLKNLGLPEPEELNESIEPKNVLEEGVEPTSTITYNKICKDPTKKKFFDKLKRDILDHKAIEFINLDKTISKDIIIDIDISKAKTLPLDLASKSFEEKINILLKSQLTCNEYFKKNKIRFITQSGKSYKFTDIRKKEYGGSSGRGGGRQTELETETTAAIIFSLVHNIHNKIDSLLDLKTLDDYAITEAIKYIKSPMTDNELIDIMRHASDDNIESSIKVAELLEKWLDSHDTYYVILHRDKFETLFFDTFKKLDKINPSGLSVNSWNKSDIILVNTTKFSKYLHVLADSKAFRDLSEYNNFLQREFKVRDFVPVSLKKVALYKTEEFNADTQTTELSDIVSSEYAGKWIFGSGRKFFKTAYLILTINKKTNVQFRIFSGDTGFAGEVLIKGSNARGGKISQAALQVLLDRYLPRSSTSIFKGKRLKDLNDIKPKSFFKAARNLKLYIGREKDFLENLDSTSYPRRFMIGKVKNMYVLDRVLSEHNKLAIEQFLEEVYNVATGVVPGKSSPFLKIS